jgi:hypothetical protein
MAGLPTAEAAELGRAEAPGLPTAEAAELGRAEAPGLPTAEAAELGRAEAALLPPAARGAGEAVPLSGAGLLAWLGEAATLVAEEDSPTPAAPSLAAGGGLLLMGVEAPEGRAEPAMEAATEA